MEFYGNLTNRLMFGNHKKELSVGDGATLLYWSDRHACTIIKISDSGKTIWVQQDEATRTDDWGMSESQEYSYKRNPYGRVYRCHKNKNGKWLTSDKIQVAMGIRDEYYDYSF